MLDTLKISKRFIKAGMPPKEAEVVADVLKDCEHTYLEKLATKDDIKNLEQRLEAKIQHLKEYMNISTVVITLGFTALGLLITYHKV